DVPAKAAAYAAPELPDRELSRWNVDAPGKIGLRNIYFVMLDEAFPPGIRNRALYMGSMFRIGFEAIYVVGGAALVVLACSAAAPHLGAEHKVTSATKGTLAATAIAQLLVFVWALVVRPSYHLRRKLAKTRCDAWRNTY